MRSPRHLLRLEAVGLPLLVVGVGLAIALASVWAAQEVYEAVVEQDGVAALDRPALELALQWRTPGWSRAVTLFTDLGGPVVMPALATVAAAALAWWWRSWLPVVLMAVAGGGSLLMTAVGKAVIGRVRPSAVDAVPPLESSPSFPSGHSLNALVIVGMVAYLAWLRLRSSSARTGTVFVAGSFAVAMGLSRVYLGHHWLTDVLVAWALGLAWLSTLIVAHRLWLARARAVVWDEADEPVPASDDGVCWSLTTIDGPGTGDGAR